MSAHVPPRPRPLVMAHRGNMRACPENTLAAFRRAIADGADIVETDLRVSRDGGFVCIHDEALDRTTDGRGPVARRSVAELRALSASCGREEFSTERIPLLEEVAGLLAPTTLLAIELKSDRFCERDVCDRLASTLKALGIIDRTMVLSFSRRRVRTFRAVAPEVPTGLVSIHSIVPPAGVDLVGPHWPLLFLNPSYVHHAHRRGQRVCPLDPRPESKLRYYLRLGVDALLSDDPGKTILELGRIGAGKPADRSRGLA